MSLNIKLNENFFNVKKSYLFSEIAKRVKEYSEKNPDKKIIRLGIGDVTLPLPRVAVTALKKAADEMGSAATFRGYAPEYGYDFLREKIADYYKRFSVSRNSEEIFVSDGAKSDVGNIVDILGDNEILIPDPVYPVYLDSNVMSGHKISLLNGTRENGFLPMPDNTEKKPYVIYLCSPNNPTGAVWKPETVKAIAQWAIEHHVWVISDEIYEHLNYDGAKTTYIGAAVPEVRSQLLVLNGVAKTYAMPGWRVGWMIAPVDVAKAASKLQGHMTSNVNNISQRAAIEAVSGSLDAVYEMRAAFDKRRQTIVAALNDIEGVNCPTPTGAFYAFADVTALLNKPIGTNKTTFANTSELAAALLDEGHVAAVPGEAFGAPGYLRFSYALADDDLVEGMRRMKRWVED